MGRTSALTSFKVGDLVEIIAGQGVFKGDYNKQFMVTGGHTSHNSFDDGAPKEFVYVTNLATGFGEGNARFARRFRLLKRQALPTLEEVVIQGGVIL